MVKNRNLARAAALAASLLGARTASAAFTADVVGVYDSPTQLNAVDQTATGPISGSVSLVSLVDFTADMATAFANDTGGVVNFDNLVGTSGTTTLSTSLIANYGASFAKSLTMTSGTGQYQSSNAAIGAVSISGTTGNTYLRSEGVSTHVFNFDTNLLEVGFTVLARTGARNVTATLTYDDNSTGILGPFSVATLTGSGATASPDTFFGFAAPAGRTIKSLTVGNTPSGDFFVIDDLGFVAVPEPGSIALLALGALGLLARRSRRE